MWLAPLPPEPSPQPMDALELTTAVVPAEDPHKIRPVNVVMEDKWSHGVLPLLRTYIQLIVTREEGQQGPTLPIYRKFNHF